MIKLILLLVAVAYLGDYSTKDISTFIEKKGEAIIAKLDKSIPSKQSHGKQKLVVDQGRITRENEAYRLKAARG